MKRVVSQENAEPLPWTYFTVQTPFAGRTPSTIVWDRAKGDVRFLTGGTAFNAPVYRLQCGGLGAAFALASVFS